MGSTTSRYSKCCCRRTPRKRSPPNLFPSPVGNAQWSLVLKPIYPELSQTDVENIRAVWKVLEENDDKIDIFVMMFRQVLSAYPQIIAKIPVRGRRSIFTYDWKWYADSVFIEFIKRLILWFDRAIEMLDKDGDALYTYVTDLSRKCAAVSAHVWAIKLGVESIALALEETLDNSFYTKEKQESMRLLLQLLYYGISYKSPHLSALQKRPFIRTRSTRTSLTYSTISKSDNLTQGEIHAMQEAWTNHFHRGEGKTVCTIVLREFFYNHPAAFFSIPRAAVKDKREQRGSWMDDIHTLNWMNTVLKWFDVIFVNLGNKRKCVDHVDTFTDKCILTVPYLKPLIDSLGGSFQLLAVPCSSDEIQIWGRCLEHLYYLVEEAYPSARP